ncbi:MAG: hypothetical protein U0Y82_13645 [Thermoleophilia bacterium]
MATLKFPTAQADAATGWVARLSNGEWTHYHRADCAYARELHGPVRDVVRGPWRYLSHHWTPCPLCQPPVENERAA